MAGMELENNAVDRCCEIMDFVLASLTDTRAEIVRGQVRLAYLMGRLDGIREEQDSRREAKAHDGP